MDTKLRTFLTVARKASFSAAARELHLSQPAVSMQIQQLEEQYGVRLFDRLDRGIKLTPAGVIFQGYAREILAMYEGARSELMRCSGRIMGDLHIGATLTLGGYVLPRMMGLFKHKYPEVNLLLQVDNTELIVRSLADETYDICFIEGPFQHPKIKKEFLAEDELVLAVSTKHPWATRKSVSVPELLEEKLVLREPGSGTREVFKDALEEAGYAWDKVPIYLELGSTEAIKSLIKLNLGVTVISRWIIQEDINCKCIQALSVDGLELIRNFVIARRRKHPLSPQAEAFIEFCVADMSSK